MLNANGASMGLPDLPPTPGAAKSNSAAAATSPRLFRVMTPEGASPKLGPTGRTLGVRVPPDPHPDIEPDTDGAVVPNGRGMSVAPTIVDLPFNRLPKRLRHLNPAARGKDEDRVFRMGKRPFVQSAVSPQLDLLPDPGASPTHGVVQPSRIMNIEEYQAALAATCEHWEIDEPGGKAQ